MLPGLMSPCGWLEVFVLASCVAWVAGQEDLTQPTSLTIQNNFIKFVSAEFRQNAEGNQETRCIVSTFPDVPRQPQTPSNSERLAAATTRLPEPSPKPSGTCPPSKNPTEVYESESLFGTPIGAAPDVSFIREEAKSYFVAHNHDRSFSKAQVLGMILFVMAAEHERIATGIKVLKSQIQSGGLEEEPQIVIVCLPDGFREERIVNDCIENETGVMGSETSYTEPGVTSTASPFQEEDAQKNEKREIKTVFDLLKGSTSTILDNKVTQTYLPSRQPSGSFSSFVTSPEQFLSGSQPPPVITGEGPAAMDPPTTQSPPFEPYPHRTNAFQTAATLQLTVSGIIRAVLPLSISKMTAELSLSFSPLAQTSLMFPSTAKPHTSKSPSFLKPPLRLSPKTTKSSTSTTSPTTADSILPQTLADFTTAPVHTSGSHSETSGSSTPAVASATTSSKNISSPSPSIEPYHSPTTSPAISPTASQFSGQPNTMPESSSELSSTGKRWVTSE